MAINFDGTDDAIKTTTNVMRDPGFSNTSYSFTVSCWARLHKAQTATIWAQVHHDSTATQGRLVLETIASGRKFKIRFQSSSANTSASTPAYTDSFSGDEEDMPWYHLVATFTRGDRFLYINGDTDSPAIAHPDAVGGTSNKNSLHEDDDLDTVIGASLNSSNAIVTPFDGAIAEWCAWKTVLSAGDIASLYAGASPLFIQPSLILSYYPLGGPLVTSSTGTTDAFRDVVGGNNMTGVSSPTFEETPAFYGATNQSSSMFYPQTYIGGDSVPFSSYSAPAAPLREAYSESNLTGDDVIAEITQANLRKQGRISVNSGGINFKNTNTEENELSPFIDRNKNFIVAENYISIMNNRLSKDDRQDQTDEIHGGGGDGNN